MLMKKVGGKPLVPLSHLAWGSDSTLVQDSRKALSRLVYGAAKGTERFAELSQHTRVLLLLPNIRLPWATLRLTV